MRHDDKCTILRTSTVKDPITHIANQVTETIPNTGFYLCRLGRTKGNLVQMQPQGTFTQQLKLYIPNVLADIKSGDIATIGASKYIVGNVYIANRHHIEADVTYKEEV